MPVTTLDARTALIVIDMQQGILAYPLVHPAEEVVAHAATLAEAFRSQDLPVVLVNVTGGAPGRAEQSRSLENLPASWAELAPALNRQAGDHLVSKRTWGAFMHTDLDAWLRQQGVTQVVVCGVSTSIGVESTARQAYELGYHVTLAVDAMTDTSAENHAHSVGRIFPRLGETGTTAQIVGLLGQRAA